MEELLLTEITLKFLWPQGHSWDQETIMLGIVWKHAKAQIQAPKNQMGKDYEKVTTLLFQMKSRGKGNLFRSHLFCFKE